MNTQMTEQTRNEKVNNRFNVQTREPLNVIVVKKSDLNAKIEFDYKKLERLSDPFIKAKYEENGEDVKITFDMSNLKNVSQLKNEKAEKKYRFLVNLTLLEESLKKYKFSMNPNNIFYDENYIPKIKMRDLYTSDELRHLQENHMSFVDVYKCYIGGILGNNYAIEQILQSGVNILKDEKAFERFFKCQSVKELEKELKDRYQRIEEKERKTKVLVSKKFNVVITTVAITSIVLFFISSALFVWTNFFKLRKSQIVVKAMESYVEEDYVECIEDLKPLSVNSMDEKTKYILATSYAKTENLKKKEIEKIVSRIDVNSDVRELEYWIYLGRLDCKKSEDLAKSMSDDKLLIYAYMKEKNVLEQDSSKSGAKKQDRINELDENIKKIGDKYQKKDDDKSSKNHETPSSEAESGAQNQASAQNQTSAQGGAPAEAGNAQP